jgi:hypothetical protein
LLPHAKSSSAKAAAEKPTINRKAAIIRHIEITPCPHQTITGLASMV